MPPDVNTISLGAAALISFATDCRDRSIAVDSDANVYVTGYTYSTDFPTYNALNSSNNGGSDIFLTKLNSTGTGYNFSTYLGGSGDDAGLDLMVDPSANAFIGPESVFLRDGNWPDYEE